jgi:hypothetical protein
MCLASCSGGQSSSCSGELGPVVKPSELPGCDVLELDREGGVALLSPVWFEHNGKLEDIKASFVDIHQFIRHNLRADPKWAL